ncbi:MAG: glycosyltransferase family 2 protein [Actinomycetota bacterium]|nr:glycosyltransferase family 2 protein [Actinomycetota bacterium]
MSTTISVVVPVYNEASFIPEALPGMIEAMEQAGAPYRILIVENGSNDGTADLARQITGESPVDVYSLPEPDYGAAMRHGFLESDGDWVVNFDIDYFSARFITQVLEQPDDVDLVIGSKRDPESDDRRPLLRRTATRVFNILLRTVLDSGVSDTHGMKGFRRRLVDDLAPRVVSTKDLYDTELVIRAERAGYNIVEVPVVVEEIRSAKSSLIKRAPRTVAGMFHVRRTLKEEDA